MAEAAKQFFLGFIHPRTWFAALIGIVAAVLTAVAMGGALTDFFSTIISGLGGGSYSSVLSYLSGVGFGVFLAMLSVYSAAGVGSFLPLLVLLVGSVVAGLIFGLTAKKERVASKSIIGGFNLGIIYIALVVVAFVFWANWSLSTFAGFTALYHAVVTFLQTVPVDILVSFLIVWWVSAMMSIIVLSLKQD
ncbi:MAG: hypothetical protein WED04_10650 [Promethearchaeati archaeon SRVP18_Atabeyarchaeia-1]